MLQNRSRSSQHGSKIAPESSQYMVIYNPRGYLGGSRICSGGLSSLGGLLEGSWRALGPKKSSPGGPWTALKEIPREVSALLGPKALQKGGPKCAQNKVQKRFELKMVKPQNSHTVHRISMMFHVSGLFFDVKNGSKMGSKSFHRRRRRQKAS